jgi:membrane protease YdiL (CAAX protease family)
MREPGDDRADAAAATHPAGPPAPPPDRRLAAGWRVLGYLLGFVLVNLVANTVRVALAGAGLPGLVARLAFALLAIGGTLGLTVVFRRAIDRRSWAGVALPPLRPHMGVLAGGAGSALLLLALVFGIEVATGWIRVEGMGGGTGALRLAVDSGLVSLAFGVCEELAFRGYLLQTLGEGGPLGRATLVAGLLFGLFHLPEVGGGPRALSFLLFVLLLHLALVLSRLATGALWFAIGAHTVFDWGAILLGLGAVVTYPHHLLRLTRTTTGGTDDLLSAVGLGLGLLLLGRWAGRRLPLARLWDARLGPDGQPTAARVGPAIGAAGEEGP